MSTQDDDDRLRLDPPQVPPSRPEPPEQLARPESEPPADRPPADRPPADRQPGAGRPLVEGPPMSVGEPVPEDSINRTATIAGLGLIGVGIVVAVLLLLVIVFAVCGRS